MLDNLVWLILAVVLIVFSAAIPNYFQLGIFANIVEQSTFVGTLAIGLALVIIAGHIDLSVESTLALAAMVPAMLFAESGLGFGLTLTPGWLVIPASLFVSLAIGAAIGASNALLVVKLQLNAFIVTLASFIWVRGLVTAISGGRSAQGLPGELRVIATTSIFQVPLYAWMSILCFLVFAFILRRTPLRPAHHHDRRQSGGALSRRHPGRPPVGAHLHPDRRDRRPRRLVPGLRTSGASANLGIGMLFQAFAAVVIGGVSLKGGTGGSRASSPACCCSPRSTPPSTS